MIINVVIKWGIPFILTGVIGYIIKELKDNKIANKAMKQSMVLLMRSQIVGKCEKYQDLGYLPDYARSCLEDLFKEYTILGGNHGVGKLVDKIFELPPTTKE
jgi:hypothetical protein